MVAVFLYVNNYSLQQSRSCSVTSRDLYVAKIVVVTMLFPGCHQTVSVWGSGGRIELTTAKFMALQKTIQPDWYQSMADGETWLNNTSRKRVRKSVDRTLAHLDECLLVHKNSQVHTHTMKHTQLVCFICESVMQSTGRHVCCAALIGLEAARFGILDNH